MKGVRVRGGGGGGGGSPESRQRSCHPLVAVTSQVRHRQRHARSAPFHVTSHTRHKLSYQHKPHRVSPWPITARPRGKVSYQAGGRARRTLGRAPSRVSPSVNRTSCGPLTRPPLRRGPPGEARRRSCGADAAVAGAGLASRTAPGPLDTWALGHLDTWDPGTGSRERLGNAVMVVVF